MEEIKTKRKYSFKNTQKTLYGSDIYEDFVDHLLTENPDYFAVKKGYWDKTRTVYTTKKESIKELKEEYEVLYNKLVHQVGWSKVKGVSAIRKKLIEDLETCISKQKDIKKGKKLSFKVIDFAEWKTIVQTHNLIIQDKLILGEKYKIHNVGFLEMRRVDKTPYSYLHPKFKWNDADDYVILNLVKNPGLKNKYVYFARPTFGDEGVGFKNRIFEAIRKNPELKARYVHISLEKRKQRVERAISKQKKDVSL
jgi:hypothetical protein